MQINLRLFCMITDYISLQSVGTIEANLTSVRNKFVKTHLRSYRPFFKSIISVMLPLILSLTLFLSSVSSEAQAVVVAPPPAGAYTLSWYAACPDYLPISPYKPSNTPAIIDVSSPDPLLPNPYSWAYSTYNSQHPNQNLIAVSSLSPYSNELTPGQIIPFLMVITVGQGS
jgi:hypothetical protein